MNDPDPWSYLWDQTLPRILLFYRPVPNITMGGASYGTEGITHEDIKNSFLLTLGRGSFFLLAPSKDTDGHGIFSLAGLAAGIRFLQNTVPLLEWQICHCKMSLKLQRNILRDYYLIS